MLGAEEEPFLWPLEALNILLSVIGDRGVDSGCKPSHLVIEIVPNSPGDCCIRLVGLNFSPLEIPYHTMAYNMAYNLALEGHPKSSQQCDTVAHSCWDTKL